MAKAPRPGTKPGGGDEASKVRFNLVDGESVTVDMKTLTMVDRRTIKQALRANLGDDVDEMEAVVGALWLVMRRSDPTLEFMSVFERVSMSTFAEAEEAEDDSPEA